MNNPAIVRRLVEKLAALARDSSSWLPLDVAGRYYFTTPSDAPPSAPGWYIICDQNREALYAGTAEDLNKRLNSNDGSRDNFANPKRTQDPVRNFIKAFCAAGVFPRLNVLVIQESSICRDLGISGRLTDLDRANVEKVAGLFRHQIVGRVAV